MDIFNSIKEWFSGIFGDAAGSVSENLNVDEIQQQVGDVTEQAGGAVEEGVNQVKEHLPK